MVRPCHTIKHSGEALQSAEFDSLKCSSEIPQETLFANFLRRPWPIALEGLPFSAPWFVLARFGSSRFGSLGARGVRELGLLQRLAEPMIQGRMIHSTPQALANTAQTWAILEVSLVWCFAITRIVDTKVLMALSRQISSSFAADLGTRELGVLVDALPELRPQLLPSLKERAAEGASELLKPAPNLDCLETITFGAIGSCELLGSSKLVESAEPQLVEKPGFLRLSHTHVLCIIDYEIYTDTKQLSGRLERRNKGNVGAGAARSITASAVDRSACAEARALTVMQKLMCSGAHGTVTISITEPPCVSCVAALLRFGQQYPGLRINACIDGALFRYGQEMDPGEKCVFLLKKCVKVLESYEPRKTTVDAFMEDVVESARWFWADPHTPWSDKKIGEQELKFIHQVFYGCCRYQKFLKMFVTSFMYKCPATALRAEQTLYIVIAYLLFFRLEELTVPQFREFLSCGYGTPPALLALMQYSLIGSTREHRHPGRGGTDAARAPFGEQDVIGKLQSFKDQLKSVVDEVEYKATGTIKAADGTFMEKAEKKRTEFKPFNLTQPRPRLIPEPDVISREVKAQPVPSSIHKNSLKKVEEEKKKKYEEEKAFQPSPRSC
eukprot:g7333.t1